MWGLTMSILNRGSWTSILSERAPLHVTPVLPDGLAVEQHLNPAVHLLCQTPVLEDQVEYLELGRATFRSQQCALDIGDATLVACKPAGRSLIHVRSLQLASLANELQNPMSHTKLEKGCEVQCTQQIVSS